MKKQARIKFDVIVPIADEEKLPSGAIRMFPKVYTNFKEILAQMLSDGVSSKSFKDFSATLEGYCQLDILAKAGVQFTPLTTEEALKIEDCTIEEVEDD